jgi:hypothetical protein
MPKNAIDYSRTIIYKLCCKDPIITDIYVGHTTYFNNRKGNHKTTCNNPNDKGYNTYVYQFIRDNGGFDNFDMIQIEAYCCNNKREAEARERFYIENLKASLNKNIPTRTMQEWREEKIEQITKQRKEFYEENKVEIIEKIKEYYENNKEQILLQKREYYKNNKDKIAEKYKKYYENNKNKIAEKKKIYRENNKNKIAEINKEWCENNKDKLAEKYKVKMTCECGAIFCYGQKSKHIKTLKHQDYLNSIL